MLDVDHLRFDSGRKGKFTNHLSGVLGMPVASSHQHAVAGIKPCISRFQAFADPQTIARCGASSLANVLFS